MHTRLVLTVTALLLSLLCGCSSSSSPRATGDPLNDLRDPDLPIPVRLSAMDAALAPQTPAPDRAEAREAIKTLAWAREAPFDLREGALERLLADPDPAAAADTREMVRLMIPQEEDLAIVAVLASAASERGWTETVPSLVRSLSRPGRTLSDNERPEYRAISALRPGESVAQAAFAVFLDPPREQPRFGVDWTQRTRAAAWDVLTRLDSTGEIRGHVLDGNAPLGDPADRVVADLRACRRDLACVPVNGEELNWLAALRDPADAAVGAWWRESAAAFGSLTEEQRRGMRLRHVEPVRWAAANRPAWIASDRGSLLSELERRLSGRDFHRRTARDKEVATPPRERLVDYRDTLSWGDLLAVLVVDEALAAPQVRAKFFEHEAMDRADRTTEYGGLLLWSEGEFRAVLYPPRPAQRQGDESFTASADMIARGPTALAHYHLHAQEALNGSFAGPSPADLRYAAKLGRLCVVLTSIRPGVLGADVYHERMVLDLGEVRKN